MCGILGWVGNGAPPFEYSSFKKASDIMGHRGPNDEGIWQDENVVLGHRRLSIIDLSNNGHQPMSSLSGKMEIVFNGEIYNYVEIRKDLQKEKVPVYGGTDTTVLLELLERNGTDSIKILNGMFAFAIWDKVNKNLILCRDRFGVKPLYYRLGKDGIAFSSEPKSIIQLYPECRSIDMDTVMSFLIENELYTKDRSFYEGIKVFPKAHYGVYSLYQNKMTFYKYWDYPVESDNLRHKDANVLCDEFNSLLEDSIRIRMRSDVPVGITLSGGLDSTAILTAAQKYTNNKLVCYTSVYKQKDNINGSNELHWAVKATDNSNAELIPVVANNDDWLDVMSDIVWYMDGPGYSPAVYPLWCIMKKAKNDGITVLLEGQGADEALAGYAQYAVLDLLSVLTNDSVKSPKQIYNKFYHIKNTFTWHWALAWIIREKYPFIHRLYRKNNGLESVLKKDIQVSYLKSNTYSPAMNLNDRLKYDHSVGVLPGLLQYGDSISMAHSIEARNPFMDYRLVEWMFNIPNIIKIRDGQTKWVLREYLRKNNQTDIGNRKDKKGYPTPVSDWLANKQGRDIEGMLTSKNSLVGNWCETHKISKLFESNRMGVMGSSHQIYKLLSTHLWLERCLK